VYQGGQWSPVGATCSPTYDPTFDVGVHQYTFTPTTALNNVEGVMLFGAAAGTADGNGFIGVAELQVFGEIILPHTVDLRRDHTALPGTTPFSNHSQYGLANLIDDDLTTYDTTVNSGADGVDHDRFDNMGVMFAQPLANVSAIGIVLKFFDDGGWLDLTEVPLRVEYSIDGGWSWPSVSGLYMGVYSTDYPLLELLDHPVETGFLFAFDTIPVPIDGIRIRGDGGGTADPYPYTNTEGFLAATEIEVFTDGTVFTDGFETGDATAWSGSVP
jgi:hypothetical protein